MFSEQELIDKLAIAVKAAGSQRKFAFLHNIHPSDVNATLRKKKRPMASIADALGMRRVYAYAPLEERL